MLQLTLISAVTIYLVIACCLFALWLDLIQQGGYLPLSQQIFSRLFLIFATLLWPLVVPFAYIELLLKSKTNRKIIGLLLDQPIEVYRK